MSKSFADLERAAAEEMRSFILFVASVILGFGFSIGGIAYGSFRMLRWMFG